VFPGFRGSSTCSQSWRDAPDLRRLIWHRNYESSVHFMHHRHKQDAQADQALANTAFSAFDRAALSGGRCPSADENRAGPHLCPNAHVCCRRLKTKINNLSNGDPMSRKLLAPAAILLGLTLAACGGDAPAPETAPTDSAPAAPATPAPATPAPEAPAPEAPPPVPEPVTTPTPGSDTIAPTN